MRHAIYLKIEYLQVTFNPPKIQDRIYIKDWKCCKDLLSLSKHEAYYDI